MTDNGHLIEEAAKGDGDMTVDTDPAADDHRDLIGYLRDNANELGIIAEPGGK